MNAISARYGFLNKSHVLQINNFFKRALKYVRRLSLWLC